MKLRRVIVHMRRQDWPAIVIDLVIVVAGVFIGMQVSNWNTERETQARAQVFGERLHLTLQGESDDAVDAVSRQIAAVLAGASVRAVPPSLEDVFIATLARKEQASA